MGEALKEGYFGIFRFTGRMSVTRFWLFASANTLLAVIAMLFVTQPVFDRMAANFERIAHEHPEDVTVQSGMGHYSVEIRGHHPELLPDMEALVGGIVIVSIVFFLSLAAAASRRLHDSNRRGGWIWLPMPFLIIGFAVMPRLFENFSGQMGTDNPNPDMTLFFMLFANNLIYLICMIGVVVLLAMPGSAGPNRFGETPGGSI